MHSRIFQIQNTPISREDRLSETRYTESFFPNADYVVEVTFRSADYNNDLKWLQTATTGLEVNIKKRTVKVLSKKEYFSKKFENFQRAIKKLNHTLYEEFISNNFQLKYDILNLEDSYNDAHSFYIDDNDTELGFTTLDEWVRNAVEGEEYFIGSIFDYHY